MDPRPLELPMPSFPDRLQERLDNYENPASTNSQHKMVLKIVGASMSTCTRRVATVCKALNVPYELTPVDFKTVCSSP
jgi:hypothetical protein